MKLRTLMIRLLPLLFLAFSEGFSQLQWYWKDDTWIIAPAYSPSVLKLDAERWIRGYHCWYAVSSSGGWDIYHTFSTDGVNWLAPWPDTSPALRRGSPGDFDAQWAIDPRVFVIDSQLVMYYAGYDGSRWQTGVAFSADGIRWNKYPGNPVLRTGPGWDGIVAAPCQVIENLPGSTKRFTMYYTGFDGAVYRIGIAYSDDGLTWKKRGNNPVLDAGPPGAWDQYGASANALIIDRGVYYLFYQATKPSPLGVATSTDGVTWTKFHHNPILQPPFEGSSLGFGSLLLENGLLHYRFSLEYPSWGICYAVSPWNPDVITGVTDAASLPTIALLEPYPNPFNPSTTIRYELPEPRDVRLSVYDMIGREVSVLVNERMDAGVHEVRFDGSGLASGVYLARLIAGGFAQTRKLLLLQ